MKLDPHVFESLGLAIIKQAPDTMMTERIQTASDAKRFKSFFGTSPIVCAKLWDMLDPEVNLPDGALPKHLLWGLGFIKVYRLNLCYVKWLPHQSLTKKPFANGQRFLLKLFRILSPKS